MTNIDGSILYILNEFLTNRRKRIADNSYFNSFTNVKSRVLQGSVLGTLLFILFKANMWRNISCRMISYADYTSLLTSISRPNLRSCVTESFNNDLITINSWCDKWSMKVNPYKTKSIVFSSSCTQNSVFPDLSIDGTRIDLCDSISYLGMTLHSKLTFET